MTTVGTIPGRSSRTLTRWPAWRVVTRSDAPSCRKSAGKLGVWTARNGVGASILGRSGSSIGLAGELGVAMIPTFHERRRHRPRRAHEALERETGPLRTLLCG